MSKPSVEIPTPCSQQWTNMKPTEGGRFCESCQKTVMDFTAMTDGEVIQAMSQQKDQTCGRFRAEQLNRPLRTISLAPYPQRHLFGLLTAGLLGWHTTQAQVNVQSSGNVDTNVHKLDRQVKNQAQPKSSGFVTQDDSSRTIAGRVISGQDGVNLPGVMITIKGTSTGVTTDATGGFRVIIPAEHTPDLVVLSISSIGFMQHEVSVKLNEPGSLLIALHEDAVALGEVIVVGNYRKTSFLDRLRNRLPARH